MSLAGVVEAASDRFDFKVGGHGFVWSYPERLPGRSRTIRLDIAVLFVGDEAEAGVAPRQARPLFHRPRLRQRTPRHGAVGLRILTVATNPDRASYFPAIEKKYGQPMTYWFDRMAQISDRKYAEQIAFLGENHGFSQAHANALVLYSRGSTNAHRVTTIDEYLEPFDDTKRATVRAIFTAITSVHPAASLVVAWNQPMINLNGQYIFGVSVHSHHILIAPWGNDVLEKFRPRLTDYKVNKKTIQVPVDWKPDVTLIRDMVDARVAEINGLSGS